jgi:MarR family transcriptional regulator for hemolysin
MSFLDPNRSFGFLLHDAARLLGKRFDQRAREVGLTRAQCKLLAYLALHEGIHQAGLADLLEIEPITLVRLLDRMEEAGWIERRPDPSDRRARRLFLAEKARPLFTEIRRIADATRKEAMDGLSVERQELLIDMLVHIRANLLDREVVAADAPKPAAEAGSTAEETETVSRKPLRKAGRIAR